MTSTQIICEGSLNVLLSANYRSSFVLDEGAVCLCDFFQTIVFDFVMCFVLCVCVCSGRYTHSAV